jgi:hypothetical protein
MATILGVVFLLIGPSEVRATSGQHLGFLFFLLPPLYKTTEGVVVGFEIRRRSVRVLKLHRRFILTEKKEILTAQNILGPPWPPLCILARAACVRFRGT